MKNYYNLIWVFLIAYTSGCTATNLQPVPKSTDVINSAPTISQELSLKFMTSASKFCPQAYVSESDIENGKLNKESASITINNPVVIELKYKDLDSGKVKFKKSSFANRIQYGISNSMDPILTICTEFNPIQLHKNSVKLSDLKPSEYKFTQTSNSEGLPLVKVESLKRYLNLNAIVIGLREDKVYEAFDFDESNEVYLPGRLSYVLKNYVIADPFN